MNKIDVIRAWRDPEYRASLRADDVPSHPAGLVELTDEELVAASGLAGGAQTTAMTCTEFTFRAMRRCCPK